MVWKAAWFDTKNNPKRDQAVWMSQGPSRFDAYQEPQCSAVFGRAGASGPGTLRAFARTLNGLRVTEDNTLPVSVTSLSGESRASLDLVAFLKSESEDIPLEWGDMVEVTHSTGTQRFDGLDSENEIDVRLDLGKGNFFANAENASGPVLRLKTKGKPSEDDVFRAAGVAPYFVGDVTLRRANEEGLMQINLRSGILHGDVLEVTMAEPKPMSELALREGFHICQSLEGPFWNVGKGWEPLSAWGEWGLRKNVTIWTNLLQAAVSPSGLPLQPIDWTVARVRYWTDNEWHDVPLTEASEKLGTIPALTNLTLILPASKTGSRTLPEELRAALTESAGFDWQLGVLDEPLVKHRYEPPFFRIEEEGETQIWRDLDASLAPRPVTADINQLLMTDPRHAGFGSMGYGNPDNLVHVTDFKISQQNPPAGLPAVPSRRKLVLPPSNQR